MRLQISVIALSFCINSWAQITVTNSDMPQTNDILTSSTGNPQDVIDPHLTGTNYTWDFSHLTAVAQRTDTFMPVTSTPLGYQLFFNNQFVYPDHVSDYGVPSNSNGFTSQLNFEDVYNYYRVENDAWIQTGYGATISSVPTSVRYQPTDTVYVLPLDYGNTASNDYYFELSIPTFGTYGQWGTRVDTVDGWGTVITPFGTFNALRVKSTLYRTDTTYIDLVQFGSTFDRPVETQYKWLANGEGIPVLTITESAGQVTSVEYKDNFLGLDVSSNSIEQINVYPNPSDEYIRIDGLSESGNLSVFDLSGRVVLSLSVEPGETIDIQSLSSGEYTARLESKSNILNCRFIVK